MISDRLLAERLQEEEEKAEENRREKDLADNSCSICKEEYVSG